MARIIKYFSGWASTGVGMEYAKDHGFECAVFSEYDPDRCDWFCDTHPNAICIPGDFTDPMVMETCIRLFKEKECELAIFSPNCQPFSGAGGKHLNDPEAFYFTYILEFIRRARPRWIWIENAREFLSTVLADDPRTIQERIEAVCRDELGYDVNCKVQDCAEIITPFGMTPQHRRRSICLISSTGRWEFPAEEKDKTKWMSAFTAIDWYPKIDAGERSVIPYHFRPYIPPHQVAAIENLGPGENASCFPNMNGTIPLKPRPGHAAQRGPKFAPWPTIVQKSASPTGFTTLHYESNGVLSIAEIITLTGLPQTWNIPMFFKCNYQLIRDVLGECMAPRYCEALLLELRKIIPNK